MKIIELKNISKTYRMGKIDLPVLRDISLDISRGEFVAIMGPSGSGKSTLLHILGLLDKPTSGQYILNAREVSQLPDDMLAKLRNAYIGYVFQQFNLLSRMSAKENVSLPVVYSDTKQSGDAEALLKKVGLPDRIFHRPNELSGGQQQRVAIARSLINNPFLIFADEPTGNLDSKSAFEIIDILKELNKSGITIVMVTHEPDLAQAATRMIRLQDGKIVSDEIAHPAPARAETWQDSPSISHHTTLSLSRIKEYFFQAIRSLTSNKTRSGLSVMGILIGVASLIAMLALGRGAQEQVNKNISSLGSSLLVVRPSSPMRGGISFESGSPMRFNLQDVYEIKDRVAGVSRIAPYVSGRAQTVYRNSNWNTRVDGTTADFPVIRNSAPERGRFFTQDETISRAKVAVLGQTVAEKLFGENDPVGEFIKIQRIDFQVIGVLPKKGSSGWRDEDDKIVIPVNTAMYRLLGREFVDSIDVQVSDNSLMDDVSEKMRGLLISLHRLSQSQGDAIDIRNMADIQETISATTKTFTYLLGSIAFISLLVGGIGIMNIMLVSVTERTREIGLRKAIGANNRDILFQFIFESVIICAVGGGIGIITGALISLVLSHFAGWAAVISPFTVVLAFTFSLVTGLVFGIWPARRASQLNPIDALRYE